MKQVFIVGPTAAGKSSLAMTLARESGAVICSADAFQIYRQLDIGTGKPTAGELSAVPHYLLDQRDPLENFSVADYLQAAQKTLTTIPSGKPQLWVGGTGLYIRALREGLTLAPESDPELVARLSASSLASLQEQIRSLDPVWCATADLQNPRRIIRALAVTKSTGKAFSTWQRERSTPLLPSLGGVFLLPERELNRTLIAKRVRKMWDQGWPDEVRSLLAISGWRESQSAKALGYLLIADYLDGKLNQADCLEKIITLTCQYAKRQETWFKTEPGFKLAANTEEALKFLRQELGVG